MPDDVAKITINRAKDIWKKTRKISLPPPHNEFTQAIVDKFNDIDENNDYFLNKEEIDKALGNPTFTGYYGAMLAAIKTYLCKFERLSWNENNDGITRADITSYDLWRLITPNYKVIKDMEWLYSYGKKKINNINRELFPRILNWKKTYNMKQGQIGDCWFLAAMVGVALRNEGKELWNMIKPLQSRFEVKFPGITQSITVMEPTDGEIALLSTAGSDGLWVTVLEKAYATHVNPNAYWRGGGEIIDSIKGGKAKNGIKILTGNNATYDNLSSTPINSIHDSLEKAFENEKVVVTDIVKEDVVFNDRGLVTGHSYTVTDFEPNPNDQNKALIRVRNPWGGSGGKLPKEWIESKDPKGQFVMSLGQFVKDFDWLCYEE